MKKEHIRRNWKKANAAFAGGLFVEQKLIAITAITASSHDSAIVTEVGKIFNKIYHARN